MFQFLAAGLNYPKRGRKKIFEKITSFLEEKDGHPVSGFNEFEPRMKSPKTGFN